MARSPAAAAAASLLLPGAGQALAGRRERGLAIGGTALAALIVAIWMTWRTAGGLAGMALELQGGAALAERIARLAAAAGHAPARWVWLGLVPFWLAAAADAARLAGGRRLHSARLAALALLPFYIAAWQSAEVSPQRLASGYARVRPLFAALLAPDFVDRERATITARTVVYTPCPEGAPSPAPGGTGDADAGPGSAEAPRVGVEPPCAPLGTSVTARGSGFPAASPVELTWLNPGDSRIHLGSAQSDAGGTFTATLRIPLESVPEIYRARVQRQALAASVLGPPGAIRPSHTLGLILAGIGVTIALGFLATLVGAILAVPLSLLAARNLMGANRASRAVYALVRLLLNFLRAIEPVILAVVFVVWVKQGPFAGMLALTIHTVAALGKLYSEQIESIDPGPVEALRATGADWLQTVAYAVLPQVVPPFIAFTVYRWDINVRMSTIIGFVGGGGIGFLLQQWIQKSRWAEAATAVIVIALVVMLLDTLSRVLRERIGAGRDLVAPGWRPAVSVGIGLFVAWAFGWPGLVLGALVVALAGGLATLGGAAPAAWRARIWGTWALFGFFAFTAWSWRAAEVEPALLVEGAPKIRGIMGELLQPALLVRGVLTSTAEAAIVIPCPAGGTAAIPPDAAALASPSLASPALSLSAACGDAGDTVEARGSGFPGGATTVLRWLMPEGGRLAAGRPFAADEGGGFARPVILRPLLAQAGAASGAPMRLQAEASERVGRPRLSPQLVATVDLLIETLLMALIATSFGAVLALPLGLLGARNLMPRSPAGNLFYGLTRTFLNVLRAIEPLILAAFFAAWVGYGSPFAGVLALTLVTLANLGKLFSEAVESIEPGPVEAIEAVGAGRLQTVAYAVIPQVIPPFLSFGIYHWDINVRISTVVGFVGGGGIGFLLYEWMNRLQWSWAATAILGIALVVTAMDALSARLRQRLA